MTKKTIIIKPNMTGFKEAQDYIGAILTSGHSVTVDIEKGERKARTMPQNAVYAVWIGKIGEHQGNDIKTVRNNLKRDYGIDIILSGITEYAVILGYILDKCSYENMTYEQKGIFLDAVQVTSKMTTKQFTKLMEAVQRIYAEQGLILEVR